MRTASRKALRRHIKTPQSTLRIRFIKKKANQAYQTSINTIKEKPLITLGTFLALGTLSGLFIWYKHK